MSIQLMEVMPTVCVSATKESEDDTIKITSTHTRDVEKFISLITSVVLCSSDTAAGFTRSREEQ